ncbi:transposase family protein [Roseibium sp. TrichSKD4]|nr:transposase family protein [Roseibium sp. TrichSKD4]
MNFAALIAERIVTPLFPWGWVFGNAFEPVLVSPVQIPQGLLLAGLGNCSNPVKLVTKQGQFASLRRIADILAGSTSKPLPMIAALLQGDIVNQTTHASKLGKQIFLLWCRAQFITIAALNHARTLTLAPKGNNMDYRTGRHVVYLLHVHLVFVTKYRRNVLSEPAIQDLKHIFAKVCTEFEAKLVECDGEDDHVHLLVHYPPKIALSKLVNRLKGVSSRTLREYRPEITGRYHKGVLWSPAYFAASCGGAPLSVIAKYVKSQREAAEGRTRFPPRPEGRGIPRGER